MCQNGLEKPKAEDCFLCFLCKALEREHLTGCLHNKPKLLQGQAEKAPELAVQGCQVCERAPQEVLGMGHVPIHGSNIKDLHSGGWGALKAWSIGQAARAGNKWELEPDFRACTDPTRSRWGQFTRQKWITSSSVVEASIRCQQDTQGLRRHGISTSQELEDSTIIWICHPRTPSFSPPKWCVYKPFLPDTHKAVLEGHRKNSRKLESLYIPK